MILRYSPNESIDKILANEKRKLNMRKKEVKHLNETKKKQRVEEIDIDLIEM